jgi:ribosome-associated translation inhibitor RaiA
MIVHYKSLEKSDFIQKNLAEKWEKVLAKFPLVHNHHPHITVEMLNSPKHAGKDWYRIKFSLQDEYYGTLVQEAEGDNIYAAIEEVFHHLPQRLNKIGDKKRVKRRKSA